MAESNTAQDAYSAFLTLQKAADYTLGDIEGTADADMLKYTKLKIASSQETESNETLRTAINQRKADYDDYLVGLRNTFYAECEAANDEASLPSVPQ